MDRMILPILGAIFLLLMGWGSCWVYDHHEPIGFHVHIFGPINPGFDLPDSLLTQKEKADHRAQLAENALVPWQRAYAGVSQTLSHVQAAQQAVIDAGQIKLKAGDSDARWSLGALQAGEAARQRIASQLPPAGAGDGACSRAEAVDAAFAAELRKSK